MTKKKKKKRNKERKKRKRKFSSEIYFATELPPDLPAVSNNFMHDVQYVPAATRRSRRYVTEKSQRRRDGDRILLQMRFKVLQRWAQRTNTAFAGCRRGSLHLEEITMWSGCEKRRRGRVGVMAAHGPTSIAAAAVAAGCCNNCSNSQPEPRRKEIQRKG